MIMSKSCKGCTQTEHVKKSNPAKYKLWKASHKYSLNYRGSYHQTWKKKETWWQESIDNSKDRYATKQK